MTLDEDRDTLLRTVEACQNTGEDDYWELGELAREIILRWHYCIRELEKLQPNAPKQNLSASTLFGMISTGGDIDTPRRQTPL